MSENSGSRESRGSGRPRSNSRRTAGNQGGQRRGGQRSGDGYAGRGNTGERQGRGRGAPEDRNKGARGESRGRDGGNRGGRSGSSRDQGYDRRNDRRSERTPEQQIYDGPPIPDDISAKDLDKFTRIELQGLPEKLADKVARHLVMAGLLLHEDPEAAHKHALAARARALRTGIVREAVGETAYARGSWAEALSEFRAARRMTGRHIYAPMMADCERALKRPEKALEYDTSEIRNKLDDAGNIELTIVMAGARRDLGQGEAALQLLETEPLNSKGQTDWLPRLRYAYADTLLAVGRKAEAIQWFHRTVAADAERLTDAEERLADLGE